MKGLTRGTLAACLSAVVFLLCSRQDGGLQLAHQGQSGYSIILQPGASATDSLAARELQRYLAEISGAALPVLTLGESASDSAIWIGGSGRVKTFPIGVDWAALKEDGFLLAANDSALIIAGGREKGTLYGVYHLLETYLGCRKYSPEAEVIPRSRKVILPRMHDLQVPGITFREPHYYPAFDDGYREWHKLDTHRDEWSMWVHTFNQLVPPSVWFNSHPEYFSEVNGIRIPDGQLCLSNPDVFRLVVEELRRRMAEHPEARYWSVSQNDTYNPCQCEECSRIDREEGSHAGSLIRFVNRVAAEFPDKIIATLAYQYTRRAPLHVKPADNVLVVLCTIECNRSRPIEIDPSSRSFVKDIRDWSRITDNILVWDYVVQFRNLVSPFPNLQVLQPNIRFFLKNGVKAMFQQGAGNNIGELAELRSYLIAKLLWNPRADVEAIEKDFLEGYYGKAAPFLKSYLDLMHTALKKSGRNLYIYGYPFPEERGYLSAKNMDRYSDLFDEAETAVADTHVFLERVRTARLPLMYALLEQARVYGTGPRGFFRKDSTGVWRVHPEMRRLLDDFVSGCDSAGIRLIEEHGTTPRQYQETVERCLSLSMQNHLALFKPVKLLIPASPKYHSGEASALTDGLKGINDYHSGWLGFEGEHLDAIIDLGQEETISEVSVDFLQDIMSWVWMPLAMEVELSRDGENFISVGRAVNDVPDHQDGAGIKTFAVTCTPHRARFVRVQAENRLVCPDWHKGAGGKAWIFADEILVK